MMRKIYALRNFVTSFIPFILLVGLGFWKVNVWQSHLDSNIYALNQLFFQIFAYLSIAEAGIGALVLKEYYRLFVSSNYEDICIYYTLSKRMFRKISLVIFGLGLVVSFFLPFLAKGNHLSLAYMQRVFVLFLAKSLVDYVMFSPRFILQADQKIYKINLEMNAYKILEGIMEVLLILWGVTFETVLVISFILRIIMNWHLNHLIFKIYPWLKVTSNTKGYKIQGMSHILLAKIVSAIDDNIDVVLLSACISPLAVIIYSNYNYITKYINDFVYMLSSSLTSGLGNLIYQNDNITTKQTFEKLHTLFYFLGCFLTICLGYCINSFMVLWVGSDKLFSSATLIALLFIFFHHIVRRPLYMLKDIFALYSQLQIPSIIEALVNFGLSLCLVSPLGIFGVILASVIAIVVTDFWYVPYFIYQHVFQKKPYLAYLKYIFSLSITILLLWVSLTYIPMAPASNYLWWFIQASSYALVILCVLGIIFYMSFQSFRALVQEGKWLLLKK